MHKILKWGLLGVAAFIAVAAFKQMRLGRPANEAIRLALNAPLDLLNTLRLMLI